MQTTIEDRDTRAQRRFRIIVSILVLLDVVALVLQYTGHGLLPARKTSTLWGILAGFAASWMYFEYRWSPRRRD